MPYTCKITNAAVDTTGQNANINITLVITNDADSSVVLTRVIPTNGINGNQLKALAAQLVSTFVVRDDFYPVVKAAADGQFILAQG